MLLAVSLGTVTSLVIRGSIDWLLLVATVLVALVALTLWLKR